ncbi:probable inactive leucine-rich repeat receptor kinase At3g03770 [Olea europaea subsp. europaea]|uniref:Probable inactive leucine-rich repeat receptor kinase At3g03770 n=1 Tax=Olea europaea subsp. europaea TaxID=158383 RepID=A0A8S0PPI9_OLEEU|nr:probable inactive leucine-rich repeat receptor kinase At3g03770 [Olea europaea subsp. europaea]
MFSSWDLQMSCSNVVVMVVLSWIFFASITHQLRSYETQILLQLRKHLEYPMRLADWENYNGDFCNLSSPPQISIKCENNSVIELRIMGDKPVNVSEFIGFAIPNQTLSGGFSIDSFVTTLTRLTSLRVLSLVSLGMWGTLPEKIHRLYSLEALDMSSNFIFGSIPSEMSRLVKLQTFTLDGNFFNDTIPEWLNSLTNLTVLSLKNNRFKGQIPSTVPRITTLIEVVLSHNFLSGKLPDLSSLSNLRLLDLRENHLDSQLSPLPKGLTNIFLSNNSFSGSIPDQLGKLNELQRLDLSNNHLSGMPPTELFSMPNINYLNLSSNMLSGSLPQHLKCGDALSLVDISDNRLIGALPTCLDIDSDKRVVKTSGNCLSFDTRSQHPESYCKDTEKDKGLSSGKKIALFAAVIGGIVVIVVLLLVSGLLFFCKRHKTERTVVQHFTPKILQDDAPLGISAELLANARIISQAAKLGTQSAPAYRVFSIEELGEATDNFHPLAYLGESPLGKVYKGRLANDTNVAIRSLALCRKYSIQNLKQHLDLLSKLRHPHLVGLLGHCIDGGRQDDSSVHRLLLVYEFVPNGNFCAYLSDTSPEKALKWSDRLGLLIGVSKAVHFLHTGVIPPCYNNRLKTNNILLDEHRIAKLSDYGISIITDETEKAEAKGDVFKSWRSTKLEDDVYNFGFILLESLVGPIASGKREAFLLNEMTSFGSQDGMRKIVDPIVLTTSSQESLSIVVSLTNKCILSESSSRPSFEDVLWNLQYAAQVQATVDLDQKSDTTSQSELQLR